MIVFLVRHGVTLWNQEFRYQGQTDIELSAAGRSQALAVADYLNRQGIQALYCSDLSRCLQTAGIINERLGLEITVEPRFREIAFGIWEGLTYAEAKERYPEQVWEWIYNTVNFQIPQGESFFQVMERAGAAWEDIIRQPVNSVAIVTHGGVIRALLHKMGFMANNEFWGDVLKPASITVVDTTAQQHQIIEVVEPPSI